MLEIWKNWQTLGMSDLDKVDMNEKGTVLDTPEYKALLKKKIFKK